MANIKSAGRDDRPARPWDTTVNATVSNVIIRTPGTHVVTPSFHKTVGKGVSSMASLTSVDVAVMSVDVESRDERGRQMPTQSLEEGGLNVN